MIESVQVRQRGVYDFETYYENLCALQSSCPVPAIKSLLAQRTLDINGDRIRANDWAPILNAIKINKSLEYIAVRSHFITSDEPENDRKPFPSRRRTPAVRSREMTVRLCKALKDCLVQSPSLVTLELQGLTLRNRDLLLLAKGITKSPALKYFSVELCNIGDDGLEMLSRSIKNAANLTSLNLAACGLTADGAATIAKIIKHQAVRCHNEAWRESLRYRRPDLDAMPGVRRVVLNQNPLIGDRGALFLAESLKDDLWLKALDMQNCCVTNVGAKTFLQVLKCNSTMVLLDLRHNPLVDRDILRGIMEQVLINSDGQETEYKWLDETVARDESPSPKKRRMRTSSSRRPSVKAHAGSRKRSKSTSSVPVPKPILATQAVQPGPGLPWRTALRALKYREYAAVNTDDDGYEDVVSGRATGDQNPHSRRAHQHSRTAGHDESSDLRQAKAMLMEERDKRVRAEQRAAELTSENTRLKHRLELIQRDGGATILDDDQLLDHIETSFAKFDIFLQMLRQAGLGKLIAMAGLEGHSSLHPAANPPDNDQSYRVTSTPTKLAYERGTSPTNRLRVDGTADLAAGTGDQYKPGTADELYQRIKQQALVAIETRRNDVNNVRREMVYDVEERQCGSGSRNDVNNASRSHVSESRHDVNASKDNISGSRHDVSAGRSLLSDSSLLDEFNYSSDQFERAETPGAV